MRLPLATAALALLLVPVAALPGAGRSAAEPAPAAVAAGLPAPTSTNPVTGTATVPPWDPNPPTLAEVRTGRHDRYDRAVFEFTGGTPGYRVEYGQLTGIGSGAPIPLVGAATLLLVFDGAFPGAVDLGRTHDPRLPTLRQIRSGGAFEGRITFGLGLADRVGFRVLQLANPPRIAVDVAHQPDQPFTTETFWGGGTDAARVVVNGVRAAAHPGYDRVVIDLGLAAFPLVSVAYTMPNPTTVHVGLTAGTTQPGVVFGPNPVTVGLGQVRGVSFTVYDNGTVSAFITTDHRTGYRVMLLTNPTRLVIDVAH
jgi:hypothetical protein